MNEGRMSPILKSSLSILEHSMEHLRKKTKKDSMFAVLHADNAVELILKEIVRFHKMRIINKKGITISYYDCIDKLLDKGIKLPELADLDLLHLERNAIYHIGASPDADKAEWLVYDVAVRFIQRLCNDELKYNIMIYSDIFRVSIDMKKEVEITKKGILDKYISDVVKSINSNMFESAVLLSYSGIDIALRAQIKESMSKDARSTSDLFEIIVKNNILPNDLAEKFKILYYKRNQIAHGELNTSEKEANIALNLFKDIIKNANKKTINDYEEERGIFDFINDGLESIEEMTEYLNNIGSSVIDWTKNLGNQTKNIRIAKENPRKIINILDEVSNSINKLSDVIDINQKKYQRSLLKFDVNYSSYIETLDMLDNINDEGLIKFRDIMISLQNGCQEAQIGIKTGRKAIVKIKGYSKSLSKSAKRLLKNYDALNNDFEKTILILEKLIQKINKILKGS